MTQRSPGLPPWRRCQRAHGANSHAPRLQSPELITPTLKPRGAHPTPRALLKPKSALQKPTPRALFYQGALGAGYRGALGAL